MAAVTVSNYPITDTYYGGPMRCRGTVDEAGAPGVYHVMLIDRMTGNLVRRTWSDAAGNYDFQWLANAAFFAAAFDHGADPVNAAISDQLTLEPMP